MNFIFLFLLWCFTTWITGHFNKYIAPHCSLAEETNINNSSSLSANQWLMLFLWPQYQECKSKCGEPASLPSLPQILSHFIIRCNQNLSTHHYKVCNPEMNSMQTQSKIYHGNWVMEPPEITLWSLLCESYWLLLETNQSKMT